MQLKRCSNYTQALLIGVHDGDAIEVSVRYDCGKSESLTFHLGLSVPS